ncbi:hypothetical protein [Pelosinus fermentans]|uniref:CheA signal transduction histidine kinase n=1 Tax=Pelosinus fermentans JBW45 TaxID=1192197 RepID=I8TS72_9FIRM|nr:hypothetical protein [Pelosinus fermentans]AJQ26079.1 hypothetical protein JBW_00727 [Pelosinus fermentans JBW45]
MELVSEKQFNELGTLLDDMKEYLCKFEKNCQQLPIEFHEADRSQALETLTQIMEGLNYYQKLVKSAAVLLTIDLSEVLYKDVSVASLLEQLCQIFASILEAAENEDYSLLTDIIEYDLIPAISISHELLVILQERYEERAI